MPQWSRRSILLGTVGAGAATALGSGPAQSLPYAASASRPTAPAFLRGAATAYDRRTLHRWAADTWRSMVAMTDAHTGLTADSVGESLAATDRVRYTSPTNVGGYLWSTVVARDLGIITRGECARRVHQTLTTLLRMDFHEPSGMFANWLDPKTAEVLTAWPEGGAPVIPFYSSVDNAWLGAALLVVRNAVPDAAHQANRLWSRMRWDAFFDANAARPGGLVHGGFYAVDPGKPDTEVYLGNHIGIGPDVWLTTHHYDTCVSETRITTYLGLIRGQIPPTNYYALWRTFPDSCDWSWQEMQPVGTTRTYYGLDVYEGAYTYRGMNVVPGWGGSMFEELMPDVFVPEETWAPLSWGRNHPMHVRAQREHGLDDAGYGYWGFSPSSNPFGGYREYGVDLLGLNPDGYLSDEENTNVDVGFGTCRTGTNPTPTFGDGVVTPHASFLALMHEPQEAFANLSKIQTELAAYGRGGFFDAVATRSGTISRRYLALDQAMVMGATGNVLAGWTLRRAFSTAAVRRAVAPVIGIEEFSASA